jgi:hypothetical protein
VTYRPTNGLVHAACGRRARARPVRIGVRIGVSRWKRPRGRNWPARLVGKNDKGIPEEESGEARKKASTMKG